MDFALKDTKDGPLFKGEFCEYRPIDRTERTWVWSVEARDSSVMSLGRVSWFGRWRKYAFYPAPNTTFDTKCLAEIAAFLTQRDRELRKSLRLEKE